MVSRAAPETGTRQPVTGAGTRPRVGVVLPVSGYRHLPEHLEIRERDRGRSRALLACGRGDPDLMLYRTL